MLVTYFLQGEPGESPDQPNAFRLKVSAPILFSQFLKVFPPLQSDPRAKFHFRFRAVDKACGYVWVDVTKLDEEVPLFKGNIYAKILRTDSLHACQRFTRLKRKKALDQGLEGAQAALKARHLQRNQEDAVSQEAAKRHQQQQQQQEQEQKEQQKQPKAQQQQQKQAASIVEPAASTNETEGILFDFDSSVEAVDAFAPTKGEPKNSVNAKDSIGSPPAPEQPVAPAPVELNRAELVAKRAAQVEENVQRALEEKHERDDMLQKESDGMETARAQHDLTLTEWAFDASKKKRNVRTLLTTMQKVLWTGSKWKEIGLGDVLQAKQVKLRYRKAMLVVHPDRLAGESPETRFIAKRVFEAINEQYQEFLKAESPES